MRYVIVLMFGFLCSVPLWSPAHAAECGKMPAGSLSRFECEAVQQKLEKQKDEAKKKDEWSNLPPGTLSSGFEVATPYELWANASTFVGKHVIVRGLVLHKVFDDGDATFGPPGNETYSHEVMVVGIGWALSDPKPHAYGNDFILLGIGVQRGTNAYGGTVVLPRYLFLGQP